MNLRQSFVKMWPKILVPKLLELLDSIAYLRDFLKYPKKVLVELNLLRISISDLLKLLANK
jgi:hypothetical protein